MVNIPSPKGEKKFDFPQQRLKRKVVSLIFSHFRHHPVTTSGSHWFWLKCSSWILQQGFYVHWRTLKNLSVFCCVFSLSPTRLIVEALNQLRSAWGAVEGRVDSLYSALRMAEQRCWTRSRLWRTLRCSQDAAQVSTTTNSLIVGTLSWWGRRQPLLSVWCCVLCAVGKNWAFMCVFVDFILCDGYNISCFLYRLPWWSLFFS